MLSYKSHQTLWPRGGVATSRFLAAPQAEAKACAEVQVEGGVADHFFVVPIQHVLDIRVDRHARADGVPPAEIHESITSGVRDGRNQAQEIGVGTPTDEAASEIASPTS